MEDDDSDSGDEFNLFTEGFWTWNDTIGQLDFIKYPKLKMHDTAPKLIVVNKIKFNDDINPFELARFAKYFRRKAKETEVDVIVLQDVKDFVLYTAPSEILSKRLVQILHSPETERFLRALILYTQYFLQVADIMKGRIAELAYKIRTVEAQDYDDSLGENLRELRLLLGREYVLILLGINTYAKYHHMGKEKNSRSLSKRDINFFECFLKICVQIVYVALYRRNYDEISSEINRVLKTENFGQTVTTHGLSAPREVLSMEAKLERAVLRGKVFFDKTLITRKSPVVEELKVQRPNTDCRILHAGQFVIPGPPSPRLLFFQRMLSAREEKLYDHDESLGIIGLLRDNFDTALKLIPATGGGEKKPLGSKLTQQKSTMKSSHSQSHSQSQTQSPSSRSVKSPGAKKRVLELIKIPECGALYLLDELQLIPLPLPATDKVQKRRWIRHLDRYKRRMSVR